MPHTGTATHPLSPDPPTPPQRAAAGALSLPRPSSPLHVPHMFVTEYAGPAGQGAPKSARHRRTDPTKPVNTFATGAFVDLSPWFAEFGAVASGSKTRQ